MKCSDNLLVVDGSLYRLLIILVLDVTVAKHNQWSKINRKSSGSCSVGKKFSLFIERQSV